MSEKLDRFVDLMKEIFELDKSDLDFGIYRIMNLRKTKIEDFLSVGLPKKVQETLAPFAQGDKSKIEIRIAEIEAQLGDSLSSLPETVPMVKEYNDLKKQLASGTDLSALETDVYSALYSFFNRYYDEGDFVSKRRYKEGVYAIPYEGEEVKLYWANQDQYYIKTSENFKDYAFVASNQYGDTLNVHFELVDATTEQNNNKESADSKRTFMLFTEDEENYPGVKTLEYREETNELIIRFVFDIPEDKKKKYDIENYNAIYEWIAGTHNEKLFSILLMTDGKKDSVNLLQKHLKAYIAKNTFDYFIHKDLRGFLTRELDFYIKTEIMHLDDLDTENEKQAETYIAKIRAIKRVGKIIIDFLAQIEDFQKKLWLKKKFVVETNWCMTLDNIDESFWDEIIANKAQIDEWISMYAIDEVEGDLTSVGWTNPPTKEFLRQNQNLVIDTKHFSTAFKERLVESIDGLDQKTNGLMINGDNFHALRLLEKEYEGEVSCIHIDPPYNTDTSGFLYKNNYRHSSWMSMMSDRINNSLPLLKDDASFICHIDENEYEHLWSLFQNKGLFNLGTVVWDKRNPMTGGSGIALQHEYMTWFSPNNITISVSTDNAQSMLDKVSELMLRHGCVNEKVRKEYIEWLMSNEKLSGGDKAYRNITDDGRLYQSVSLRAPEYRTDPKFHKPLIHPITKKPCPVPPNGFSRTPETLAEMMKNDVLIFGEDETIQPRYKMFLSTGTKKQLTSVISDAIKGTSDIKKMDLSFPYCHSISFYDSILSAATRNSDLILDFFAGSGTTGHTVISENRNGTNKKYILVEMGEYFNTVTKPRMQKVVYSSDWKDGKPVNRNTGISQIIKYMRLESYEDALSNIELENPDGQVTSLFGDDYMINYMIDLESRGSLFNLDAFKEPFRYEMKITEKNETKKRPVDVVETFNYLIGLTVMRQSAVSYFGAVSASSPAYEGAMDLIKDNGGEFGFKQIEGTLPDGRRALVIWRTVSDDILKSNAALDAYFTKYRINPLDREYDVIFVNGDNNLENLRTDKETWKVQMTETEFKKRMFEEE